ncbi:glycine betaine ABC transporter substrate-binding protein [Maridesulfovibrio salexigens]|uniref:Substrate-binding region of ABC-type glycine betaine transport system n=1 Tax=Maridesulfovibrio salexigens (strain ATCC 14822 / DSM 2638 / NCIMB 8403 / VKM B-1763) TaxID=526222 RepID=C6BYE9_MARSD|nr:glycine betaine ABC transporter substrate-binding protein [Maridesulfovibrio salexigens]ACS78740.1 Substrate-binding region of ABC-type glycine betaine transport system [Maridesulfovibrio salexigens DSM 2638]
MKKVLTLILAALLVAAFAVPSFAGDKKKVKLAYVEWDCATATTNVLKAVIEERMGYECEIIPVAAAAMWQAVGTGDVDGLATAWLPITHADYLKRVKNKVVDLGPIVSGAKLGWAVPSYVTVDSIADLNKYADKFDDKIIGIDPGAGLMRLSEEAIDKYGLDKFELMEGSGATMTAALSDAIKNNEWVVVTAWSPHWMFGRWDLKYLEDPKKVLGESETINTIVRKGLDKDMPEVYAFLDKFAWKDANQLQMVMAWNQEKGADPYESAKRFIKENKAQVDSWLK